MKRSASPTSSYPTVKKTKVKDNSSNCEETSEPTTVMKPSEPTLLGIPRELRDMIYDHVIGGHKVAVVHRYTNCSYFKVSAAPYDESGETEERWEKLFNLSLVCRQINSETKNLSYELSFFQVVRGSKFGKFLDCLKPAKKNLIITISFGCNQITIPLPPSCEEPLVSIQLKNCASLKKVISRNTLSEKQKKMVKTFTEEFGLELVLEKRNLGFLYNSDDYFSSDFAQRRRSFQSTSVFSTYDKGLC